MSESLGYVDSTSEKSLPIWSVNNFLDNTTSNYLKIITLREICRRFMDGADDRDFLICVNSYDLFPASNNLNYREEDLIVLTSKDHSSERFWHLFRHLHRPVVLFRAEQVKIPMYSFESDAALRINSLSLHSPVSFSLQGTIGALVDLFSGKLLAQRSNERNSDALANIRNVVETAHLIEDHRTPPGVREFAIEQLEAIMIKQEKINDKLGIQNPRFRM
ncbi:MAG: hypothetical protein HKK66_12630 [Chlorobiaceae bacterium]|nr:hypothetical protein [Chlorobiaceae bacterium]